MATRRQAASSSSRQSEARRPASSVSSESRQQRPRSSGRSRRLSRLACCCGRLHQLQQQQRRRQRQHQRSESAAGAVGRLVGCSPPPLMLCRLPAPLPLTASPLSTAPPAPQAGTCWWQQTPWRPSPTRSCGRPGVTWVNPPTRGRPQGQAAWPLLSPRLSRAHARRPRWRRWLKNRRLPAWRSRQQRPTRSSSRTSRRRQRRRRAGMAGSVLRQPARAGPSSAPPQPRCLILRPLRRRMSRFLGGQGPGLAWCSLLTAQFAHDRGTCRCPPRLPAEQPRPHAAACPHSLRCPSCTLLPQ